MRILKKVLSGLLALVLLCSAVPMASYAADTQGVWMETYRDTDLTDYLCGAQVSQIGGAWDADLPPAGLDRHEYFSIRWVTRLYAEVGGTYTLRTTADDGVRLMLDGTVLIDDKGPHYPEARSATVELQEGGLYNLTVEYYNGELGGSLELDWIQPGATEAVRIPASCLFLPDTVQVELIPTGNTIQAVARMQRDSNEAYKLILQVTDSNGTVVAQAESTRTNMTMMWESETMEYKEGCSYTAYAVGQDASIVSEKITKTYATDATLTIDTEAVTGTITPYMYGACIEDVNHELYGGIWSQMIFGESFDESPYAVHSDFTAVGGNWYTEKDGNTNLIAIKQEAGGPKLMINDSERTTGEVSVDVYMTGEGPAGLIIKTTNPNIGADAFNGYEIGLSHNNLRIGRHQYNYALVSDTPCNAPSGQWNNLRVVMSENGMSVYVNGTPVTAYTDPDPMTTGDVGLRAWNCDAKYRNIALDGQPVAIPELSEESHVCNMWAPVERGSAVGTFAVDQDAPFKGKQSQRITFVSGEGAVGIDNMSLNRKGMNFVADKVYEGYFYARCEQDATVQVVLENADGTKQYATADVAVSGDQWQKYSFEITPNTTDPAGRFTLQLTQPGSVAFGYVYLQPGEWGRYKGLQVRKDVAEKLIEQGVTVLRFGGCMANADGYKWKDMLGNPEDRSAYNGWWYGHSSLGFGIVEFMNLCEALGILGIPDFNGYETAQDMADFIDFALGTDPTNAWTAKRIEMGHPEPYKLPYIQYGNEEKVDTAFAARFNAAANAVWAKAPEVAMVVGDFCYDHIITDVKNITGAHSGITNLDGHVSILNNAAAQDSRVLFDIHIWNDNAAQMDGPIAAAVSMHTALGKAVPQADFDFVCFEFNSNHHVFERALANAYGTNRLERTGIFEIICSANCLQVDGHNDNGWDQGLVFMNNDSAWLQPPAYVTQMAAAGYQPNVVSATLSEKFSDLDFTVLRSDDGKTLIIKAVNYGSSTYTVDLLLDGYAYDKTVTTARTYAGKLKTVNTADDPENCIPDTPVVLENAVQNARLGYTFAPYSYTVISITGGEQFAAGDVDKSGKVDVADIMKLKALIMADKWSEEELQMGDMDDSKALDVGDIMAIKNIIMSK